MWRHGFVALVLLGSAPVVYAAATVAEIKAKCHDKPTPDLRRACYDEETGYVPPRQEPPPPPADRSLVENWRLDEKSDEGLGITDIQSHRPTYIIFRQMASPNATPSSPSRGFADRQDLDHNELKFQLSFKTEIVSPRWFADKGSKIGLPRDELRRYRLWFGYTQQSLWQVLNTRNSSPFRDNNYEPEVILTYNNADRHNALELVNVGFAHHSNGHSGPESRSWHKAYLQGGFKVADKFYVLARRIWRIPENRLDDDNPDIGNYWGRGEIIADWHLSPKTTVSFLGRHTLRSSNRAYAQLDVSTAEYALGRSRWYLQLATGYGESLVDYNHRQKTIGFGFAWMDW